METRKGKGKMERSERAKQFMPFDALAGLQEALREKEKEATTAVPTARLNRCPPR